MSSTAIILDQESWFLKLCFVSTVLLFNMVLEAVLPPGASLFVVWNHLSPAAFQMSPPRPKCRNAILGALGPPLPKVCKTSFAHFWGGGAVGAPLPGFCAKLVLHTFEGVGGVSNKVVSRTEPGGGKKSLLKSFLVAVLLSALVERFLSSHMRDFFPSASKYYSCVLNFMLYCLHWHTCYQNYCSLSLHCTVQYKVYNLNCTAPDCSVY